MPHIRIMSKDIAVAMQISAGKQKQNVKSVNGYINSDEKNNNKTEFILSPRSCGDWFTFD